MATELKPCPFCGGKAMIRETTYGNNYDAYFVWCCNKNCDIRPSTKYLRLRKDVIEAWNRRAEDDHNS
jgi:Lar family restriction alleviation protein